MTRDDAVRRIQRILGYRTDLVDEVEQCIREAQEDLENGELGLLPWFMMTTYNFVIPASGLPETVNLPDDFVREVAREAVYPRSVGARVLDGRVQRVAYIPQTGEVVTVEDGISTRPPVVMAYWVNPSVGNNGAMVFDRPVEEDAGMQLLYYSAQAVLNSDVENGWLKNASLVMIGLAGLKTAGLKNTTARQAFGDIQQAGRSALIRQNAAYEGAIIDRRTRVFNPFGGAAIAFNDVDLGA